MHAMKLKRKHGSRKFWWGFIVHWNIVFLTPVQSSILCSVFYVCFTIIFELVNKWSIISSCSPSFFNLENDTEILGISAQMLESIMNACLMVTEVWGPLQHISIQEHFVVVVILLHGLLYFSGSTLFYC